MQLLKLLAERSLQLAAPSLTSSARFQLCQTSWRPYTKAVCSRRRSTDRPTDRQTDRQIVRQRDRRTNRPTNVRCAVVFCIFEIHKRRPTACALSASRSASAWARSDQRNKLRFARCSKDALFSLSSATQRPNAVCCTVGLGQHNWGYNCDECQRQYTIHNLR